MDTSTLPPPEALDFEIPPGEDELPYEDDIPMETPYHRAQMELLLETLGIHWQDRDDGYAGGNMFVHFQVDLARAATFRGPDFFVVKGASRRKRKSWVVWQEGKGPDIIIELLSESTAATDKGEKKRVYEQELRVPEYFLYDPLHGDLLGYRLVGAAYQPLTPDEDGWFWSEELGLFLHRWTGVYTTWHLENTWLRFATPDRVLVPTMAEIAAARLEEMKSARTEADAARQRAAELEAQLSAYRQRFGELEA
ncbi:MAG: Uma2 family endonuclease [Chloroflexaceae bacterium]|nr:Uma2 family endonuclease [Chloroflexaceae bacterium]